MTSTRELVMEAFYTCLNVSAVTTLAPVYQHVPENTQPPAVMIRDISIADEGGKGDSLERATVSIIVSYRGTKGTTSAALVDVVKDTLRSGISTADLTVDHPMISDDGGEQGDDGITYQTTITAEALVIPT